MAPRRSVTPEQEEAIRGAYARGETYAAIGEAYGISEGTVCRIVKPPPERAPAVVFASAPPRRPSPPSPTPRAAPQQAPEATPSEPPPAEEEPTLHVSEDPRELNREDWLYYERRKALLRRRAESEFKQGNLKGSALLEKEARAAEERARELRPPTPPDPETDPTYRAESRKLTQYLLALVESAERGEALPARTLPPTEPVAA